MEFVNQLKPLEEDKENSGVLTEISKSKSNQKQAAKDTELKGLKDSLLKVGETDAECKSKEKPTANHKYPASMDLNEPLCIESKNRFVLFPIQNQEVFLSTIRPRCSLSTLIALSHSISL